MVDDGNGGETVLFDEDVERSWRGYLTEFKSDVWPVMQEYGFTSFETAFQCWLINRLTNDLACLVERLDAD